MNISEWKQYQGTKASDATKWMGVLNLAVNENGVELYSRDLKEILLQFSISELIKWKLNPTSTQIEFAIAGYTSSFKVQPAKPLHCLFIIRYLNGYVSALLDIADYAIVFEDYTPADNETDVLTIKRGDVIFVLEHDPGNGWEYGIVNGEEKGYFSLQHARHSPHLPNVTEQILSSVAINIVTEYGQLRTMLDTYHH